jgi:hypothetical protein
MCKLEINLLRRERKDNHYAISVLFVIFFLVITVNIDIYGEKFFNYL